ncbi:hypothetical protein AeNC1_013517, partial [Aphanomyces euteiches]
MPVGACIDPVTKQRVAEWDMGKDPDDLTEGEWIEWFKLAYDVDPRALEGLKKRIAAAVVFDMPITDADSRIGRMLDGMSAAIRRDRQEWVLREESPGIVKIITAAIKPASLQRAVTEQMDLSRNKLLKKDVCRFVRWLREYAIGHERFVGYEEEKPVAKQVKFESGKAARVRVENKPASSQPQKVAFAPGASARASPMGCLKCVHGANAVYFTLDWMKGYWLHPESEEYYSFMTPLGIITPTRVLMGQSHAVAYCQGVVDELFGEMIMHGLLGWLDDLLGYARTASDLMDLLKRVLAICQAYGLKLHPKKCAFYTTKTIWCGKEVSAEGVAHAPARVQGLCELEPPQTAAELQQFLCATNWMRANIPEYSALVALLTKLLDIGAKVAASRKKTALARVSLSSIGWCEDHVECFESVKTTLQRMVPLAHPDPDKMVCMYTDASDGLWGAIATQVPLDDLELVASEQRHEPLAFLSGAFRGA